MNSESVFSIQRFEIALKNKRKAISVDGFTECLLTVSEAIQRKTNAVDLPALWFNNQSLVSILKESFEVLWQSGKESRFLKKCVFGFFFFF